METTDSSSQPEEIQFSFSYFNNLWSKESAVITLKDLSARNKRTMATQNRIVPETKKSS